MIHGNRVGECCSFLHINRMGRDDSRSSEHLHQQPLPLLIELNSEPHGKALPSGAVMGLSVGSHWLSCDSQKGFCLFATARRELAATNACFTFSPGFMTGCRVPVLCLSVLMYRFQDNSPRASEKVTLQTHTNCCLFSLVSAYQQFCTYYYFFPYFGDILF